MTKAEARLCDAAERFWHWGRKAVTPETRRKFDYWHRRMNRAARAVYCERTPEPRP